MDETRTSDHLRRLGIEDVKERLELSTLSPAASAFESPDIDTCCCCKVNDPIRPEEEDF
ncbi:MAG: hypothetical protein R3D98_01640 [Candidatus Krumholzibacteriia bacterium]